MVWFFRFNLQKKKAKDEKKKWYWERMKAYGTLQTWSLLFGP
jgi:hypothetical protein